MSERTIINIAMLIITPPLFLAVVIAIGTIIEGISMERERISIYQQRAETPYEFHQCTF